MLPRGLDEEDDISYRLYMDEFGTLTARLHVDLGRRASAACPGAA
jgi:hypothetical protein